MPKYYVYLHNGGKKNIIKTDVYKRQAYTVKDKEEEIELEIDNEYIMSPKDLCTIGFLKDVYKRQLFTQK